MNGKLLVCLIFSLLFYQTVFAQALIFGSAIQSPDRALLLTQHYEMIAGVGGKQRYKYHFHIFQLSSRRFIQYWAVETESPLENLYFSEDRKFVLVKLEKGLFNYDLKTGQLRQKSEGNLVLVDKGSKMIFQDKNDNLQLYDLRTTSLIHVLDGNTYKQRVLEFGETPDRQYYWAKLDEPEKRKSRFSPAKANSEEYLIWDADEAKPYKRLKAEQIVFNSQRQAVVVDNNDKQSEIRKMKMPDFQVISEFSSKDFLKEIPYHVPLPSLSKLSPSGRYLILQYILPKSQEAVVLDWESRNVVYKLSARKLPLFKFLKDTLLRLDFPNTPPQYVALPSGEKLELKKDQVLAQNLESEHFTIKRKVFNEFPYWEVVDKRKRESYILDSAELVLFLPDQKILLMERSKTLAEWQYFQGSQDAKIDLLMVNLDSLDRLQNGRINWKMFQKKLFRPVRENILNERDTVTENIFVDSVKTFEELTNKKSLLISQKSLQIQEDRLKLQFHLLDTGGNYFSGAKPENWKEILCDLYLQSSQKINLNAFNIREVKLRDSIPFSMALVLDHSGSMGNYRAKYAQQAIRNFVEQKNKKDEFSILKYDEGVGVEAVRVKDTKKLLNQLQINGLQGYGGATAIIDALNDAVDVLAQAPESHGKVIILFTDGYENCSLFEKMEVLKKAIANDIKIFTIAFGTDIDALYLENIAQKTGGTFYHIFKTSDFDRIFKDIDFKMRNYYELETSNPMLETHLGEHSEVIWKICEEYSDNTKKLTVDLENLPPADPLDSDFEAAPKIGEVKFLKVNFYFEQAKIVETSLPEIAKAAKFLQKYPNIKIELRGHTDNVGTERFNLYLSDKRAKEVKKEMIRLGISADRIDTVGMGECCPITTNITPLGRAKNRRTEMVIVK